MKVEGTVRCRQGQRELPIIDGKVLCVDSWAPVEKYCKDCEDFIEIRDMNELIRRHGDKNIENWVKLVETWAKTTRMEESSKDMILKERQRR